MVPLLLLGLLRGDARLAVRASLERPRVTYAEFGAWVQNRTGVPVSVAAAIRGRKATVLVADRPVAETMARFAEAFFLEWERTKTGLTLRLDPKVAAEEAAANEEAARLRMAAYGRAVEAAMALSALTPEEIEGRTEAANSRYAHDPAALAAGAVLRGLSPAMRESVMAGARAFASNRPGPGMATLDRRWGLELAQRFDDMGPAMGGTSEAKRKPANGVFAAIQGDPAHGRLRVTVSPTSADGETLMTMNITLGDDALPAPDGPLDARLRAWAKPDGPSLAVRLRRDPEPVATHASARRTLADLLLSLHRRSGLPIVADGFREAAWGGSGAPDGTDARAWLQAFAGGPGTPRYAVRATDGWLTMRRARYWERLATEPLEAAVRALERAEPTLDALGAFAGTVTPAQELSLGADELVMDVPNEAVEDRLPFLRLWAALSAAERRRAFGEDGLNLAGLRGEASRRALDVLGRVGGEESVNDALVPYLLPGAPPFPNDLVLVAEAHDSMESFVMPDTRHTPYLPNASPGISLRRYRGVKARIQGEERMYFAFDFPLRPFP